MHECMKEVEKGGLERLTNKLRLGVVQNLEGMKDFGEEERFGLREMRERDWETWVRIEPGRTLSIYRHRHLDRSKRYWEGVENKSLIDRRGIEEVSTKKLAQ